MINSNIEGQHAVTRIAPKTLSALYISKALRILKALEVSTSYSQLGGVKIKRRPNLIRFKLGPDYRLIIKQTLDGFEPYKIMSRQRFQRELTQRS